MECQARRLAVLAACLAMVDGLRASSSYPRSRPASTVSWQVSRATRLEEGEGSLLDSALGSLSEVDRYNVVLQGMLQGKGQATEVLEKQAWPLVAEMNKKKKKMGELTRSSLLDAAANSEDAAAMEESLKLARKNGVLGRYAAEMDVLNPLPGDARRRQALLGALPALPSDNRESEAAAAVSFLAVVVGSLLLRLFDPENGAANGALFTVTLGFVVDNFGSLILTAGKAGVKDGMAGAAAAAAKETAAGAMDAVRGRDDDGPSATQLVAAGLNRLFTRDVTRECQCEAASFTVAYLLGIPVFSLTPNALEAVKLTRDAEVGVTYQTANGVSKLLVWLLAAVNWGQLVAAAAAAAAHIRSLTIRTIRILRTCASDRWR